MLMIILPGDLFRDHHDIDHPTAADEHCGAVDQNSDRHLWDHRPWALYT